MKEIFVLVSGVSGSELIRTLAKFGRNTLAVRVMSPAEMSRFALMRSGTPMKEQFLTRREEPAVLYSIMKDVPYFASASYMDAENLAKALHIIRGLIPQKEEENVESCLRDGEFPEKNQAIAGIYRRYRELCREQNRLDTESLIRRAAETAEPLGGELVTLKEYPLTPLEQTLADRLSGSQTRELSLRELLNLEEKPVSGLRFTGAYGASNEVESILAEIYEKKIPLDQCTVATADPGTYAQLFYDLAQQYDIPMAFGSGLPIMNSNPARLLKLMAEWNERGENGIDSLKAIVFSGAFDRGRLKELFHLEEALHYPELKALCEMTGSLRISFCRETNQTRIRAFRAMLERKNAAGDSREETLQLLDRTELLAGELEKGAAAFLKKFARIRHAVPGKQNRNSLPAIAGRLDQAALQVIGESLEAYFRYVPEGTLSEIVPEILNKTVCSEISQEGCLYVTTIPGAMAAMRKNLYICGLSAAEFPGSPRENYLVLDSDLAHFKEAPELPTSANQIRRKKKELENLISLGISMGIPARLSYASRDLVELKEQNPSSSLYRLYQREYPGASTEDFKNSIGTVEYFQSRLTPSRLAGRAYADGMPLSTECCHPEPKSKIDAMQKSWSFSHLEILRQCPRRFFLKYLQQIPEEETDDPYCVIGPNAEGDLAHQLMQACSGSERPLSREEFLALAGRAFDDFLLSRPPLVPQQGEKAREEFLDMMGNAYDMESHNQVISTETDYECRRPGKISIHGLPDRVEKAPDGSCFVVDYKSGRKLRHRENDPDTCLQILIYMWLCQQAGLGRITGGRYYYLRKKRVVPCEYSSENQEYLQKTLDGMENILRGNEFPREESRDNCRYCKMGAICRWPGDPEEEEGQ